jgi:NAD(P)-dependent dehydrogenase (short-subunit alcohol dehydrogenase family)
MENRFSITGYTIVVVGCSKGLGLTIANGLVDLGANVIGISRSNVPNELSNDVDYLKIDITDQTELNKLKRHFKENSLQINSLINVAGVSLPKQNAQSEINRFSLTINNNLTAIFNVTQLVIPYFSKVNSSIVNISSINSTLGFPDNPGYVASKSGISGLTRAMAVDYSEFGIRVNSIAPGYFHTQMTHNSYIDYLKRSQRSSKTVLGRWGEVEEIVGPIVFLISKASSYVTGVELAVDGGWLIKGL